MLLLSMYLISVATLINNIFIQHAFKNKILLINTIFILIILTGITGEVIIDSNGDRVASYSLLDMNPVTSKFQVCTVLFTSSKKI